MRTFTFTTEDMPGFACILEKSTYSETHILRTISRENKEVSLTNQLNLEFLVVT